MIFHRNVFVPLQYRWIPIESQLMLGSLLKPTIPSSRFQSFSKQRPLFSRLIVSHWNSKPMFTHSNWQRAIDCWLNWEAGLSAPCRHSCGSSIGTAYVYVSQSCSGSACTRPRTAPWSCDGRRSSSRQQMTDRLFLHHVSMTIMCSWPTYGLPIGVSMIGSSYSTTCPPSTDALDDAWGRTEHLPIQ